MCNMGALRTSTLTFAYFWRRLACACGQQLMMRLPELACCQGLLQLDMPPPTMHASKLATYVKLSDPDT